MLRQKIVPHVEEAVKKEVLKELQSQSITTRRSPREKNNKAVNLVEDGDERRKIGSLIVRTISQKTGERMRFILDGIQARDRDHKINDRQLNEKVSRAIKEKIRQGVFRKIT